MKYSDEVLNAEWVLVKKSTFQRHLVSEVCAWAIVVILLSIFIF